MAAINTIKSSNRLKIESEGHRHLYLSSTSYSIEWKQTTFGSLEGSVGTAHPRLELKVKSSHGRWKSKLRLPHVNVEHGVIFFKSFIYFYCTKVLCIIYLFYYYLFFKHERLRVPHVCRYWVILVFHLLQIFHLFLLYYLFIVGS